MTAESFVAQFNDGQSPRNIAARVRFTSRGLEIEVDGLSQRKIWPYGALSTSEPLGPHAIEALVRYSYESQALLFVTAPAFARHLAEKAPHLTAKAERWRQARPWLWASAAIVALIAVISLFQLSPARSIAGLLPDSTRDYLGKQVVTSMTAKRKRCIAPAGRTALDTLVAKLSTAAGRPDGFEVVVSDWGLVNAFAVPGETIVLTKGLIEKSSATPELAGVIAHEMGHGLALHPEAGVVRSLGLTAIAQLVLGGGGNIGSVGVMLTQLAYSRDAEREADDLALDTLRKAKISPDGLAQFFRRIKGQSGGNANRKSSGGGLAGLDLLSSHPRTENRIRAVEDVAPYPSEPALSAAQWNALKRICAQTSD